MPPPATERLPRKRRTRGTGSVVYRPRDGRYEARYKGKSGYARTEREAELLLTQLVAGTYVPRRTRKPAAPAPPAPLTLADFIPRWLDHCRAQNVSRETIDGVYGPALRRVARSMGRYPLTAIQSEDVSWMLADLFAVPYASATVRMSRSVLRRCLQTAVEWQYIPVNPVQGKPPRHEPHRPLPPMSAQQALGVRDAVAGTRVQGMVVCGLYLGMRIGEVLGLRWEDVQGGWLLVRGQYLKRREHKARTKSGRVRRIPVIAPVEQALAAARVQQAVDQLAAGPRYDKSGFIFTGAGGRPLSRSYVLKVLSDRCAATGLAHTSFHHLRHMTATLLRECGVEEDVRRVVLGHESAEVHRGYLHVEDRDVRVALERLEAALG